MPFKSWRDRYIKQGSVQVGDTVYMESQFSGAVKATVTRTTKTLLEVAWDNGNTTIERTYRWQPRNECYSETGKWSDSDLLTVEEGQAIVAREARRKATQSAQGRVVQVADDLSRNRRWNDAAKVRSAIAELEQIAAELAAIEEEGK